MRIKNLVNFLIILLFLVVVIPFNSTGADELSGREIMEKADALPSPKDMTGVVKMRIISANGRERVREALGWRKWYENGDEKRLFRFVQPADVKGTGVLTAFYTSGGEDIWIYLPALRKVRRVVLSSEGSGSFMGSDFTFDDLGNQALDDFSFRLLDREVLDEVEYYRIEAVPTSREIIEQSGYSRQLRWLRVDNLQTTRIEFYDTAGEQIKVFKVLHLEKIGDYWFQAEIEMHNVQNDHRTVIAFVNLKFDTGLSDDYFTERYLRRGR